MESLPASRYPDYPIISLDHWMFNPAWDKLDNLTVDHEIWKNSFVFAIPKSKRWWRVYADVLDRKIDLRKLPGRRKAYRSG